MIIDGHAHACGGYLTPENITRTLDNSGTDKVILVPGEPNSKAEYFLPDLAALFPNINVVKATNFLTRIVIRLSGMLDHIPKGVCHRTCIPPWRFNKEKKTIILMILHMG